MPMHKGCSETSKKGVETHNFLMSRKVWKLPTIPIFNSVSDLDYDATEIITQWRCSIATQDITSNLIFMLRQELHLGVLSRNTHLQVRLVGNSVGTPFPSK